jgi:hypothetical protein
MAEPNSKIYVEYMALSDLMTRQHPDNPKAHDIGSVINSYKIYGYVALGVIDELTGLFVCGHGRTQALHMMKQQKMPAPRRIDIRSDDWYVPTNRGVTFDNALKVKAYLIADNRLTTLGGWDEPDLLNLLQEIAGQDEQVLEATGYDLDDIDDLLASKELVYEGYPTPYDSSGVAGETPDIEAGSYIVYCSFKTEEEFYEGLKALTFGGRNEKREGMRYAAIDGSALLPEWKGSLT